MKTTIKDIDGREYPLRMTMGALRAFVRATGVEISEMQSGNLEHLVALLWAQASTASAHDGVDFPYASAEAFGNALSPDEFSEWATGAEPDKTDAAKNQKKRKERQ